MTRDLLSRSQREGLNALRHREMSTRSASSPSWIMMTDDVMSSCSSLGERGLVSGCILHVCLFVGPYHPATLSFLLTRAGDTLDSRVGIAGSTCWGMML